MNKFILGFMIALTLSSCATNRDEIYHAAVWVEVGVNDDGTTVYADPASIRKSGNKVKMWRLDDFKSIRNTFGIINLSSRSLNEYDCKKKQVMVHFLYVHSGNMGRGEAVQINGEYCCWWIHASPGTINEILWKTACGK